MNRAKGTSSPAFWPAPSFLAQGVTGGVPITWDERALETWATPVAALNLRPGHFSRAEYEGAPVDNLRTYPVYYPGREPAGYWDMLQTVGPKPLIEPASSRSQEEWIDAGRRVFDEYDIPAFRVTDPNLIAAARQVASFEKSRCQSPRRWHLARPSMDSDFEGRRARAGELCRLPYATDAGWFAASRSAAKRGREPDRHFQGCAVGRVSSRARERTADADVTGARGAAPWIKDDIHESLNTLDMKQFGLLFGAAFQPGLFPRWNGSGYYPTKIPDLIGLKDRKYIDHTATHAHRNAGDLMRYAALVTMPMRPISARIGCCPTSNGISRHARRMRPFMRSRCSSTRFSRRRIRTSAIPAVGTGQKIFQREGCAGCHTPPLYTNNRLTLAQGFTPPAEAFQVSRHPAGFGRHRSCRWR